MMILVNFRYTPRGCFCALFCALLLHMIIPPALAQEPVIFDFCYENKALLPYYVGDGDTVPDKNPGLNITTLRALDDNMAQITIRYWRKPWKHCLSSIESGKFSGVIASYYKGREAIGIYPKSEGKLDTQRKFGSANYCLYKSQDSLLDWNGLYFTGTGFSPVAVPRGYSIINKLKFEKLMYFEVKSSEMGFNLLSHNRVAGVVTLCEVGKRLILNQPDVYGHFIEDQPVLVKKSAYLMISKPFYRKNPQLTEQIWNTMAALNKQ